MELEFDEEEEIEFENEVKVEIDTTAEKFECFICQKVYAHKKSLSHHLRKYHSLFNSPNKTINCLEVGCESAFAAVSELLTHLKKKHQKMIQSQIFYFDTYIDFCKWKEEIEKKTASRFTFRSSWKKKDGSLNKVFNCNRSGKYKPLSKNQRKRKIKSQGSRKIGQECPARIVVNEIVVDGKSQTKVDAILDHYGHDCELNHVSFSKDERAFLQAKLAMGTPRGKILNEIKTMSLNERSQQRLHQVKSKDLCNIWSGLQKGFQRSNVNDMMITNEKDACEDAIDEDAKLQIEVLQDEGTDNRSINELQKQICKLCVSLQGSVLTRQMSLDDLYEVESNLKSSIALCNANRIRKTGFPLDLVSVVASESVDDEDFYGSVEKAFEMEDEEDEVFNMMEENLSDMTSSPVPYHDEVSNSENPSIKSFEDFVLKLCSPGSLEKIRSGRLLSISDLQLPNNLTSPEIFYFPIDVIISVFDDEAKQLVNQFFERVKPMWKCVICCDVTDTSSLVTCNGCLRYFHLNCLEFPEESFGVWNCSDCRSRVSV